MTYCTLYTVGEPLRRLVKLGCCAFCIVVVLIPLTAGGQPTSGQLPDGARAIYDLSYVADGHERQKLDLFLPDSGDDWPLVVWIHGGAWMGAAKSGHRLRRC